MPAFIQIHPNDTVAVALGKAPKGTDFQGVQALEDIPQGHKMALNEMAANAQVIKYGFSLVMQQKTSSLDSGYIATIWQPTCPVRKSIAIIPM